MAAAAVAAVVVGNLAMVLASWRSRARWPPQRPVPGLAPRHFAVVDDRVWRSARPGASGYGLLAAAGVRNVVDLRAEPDRGGEREVARQLGLSVEHLPVRDGQPPSLAQILRIVELAGTSMGTTLVHCGAGVGRTGCAAAAYLVATAQSTPVDATGRSLAVGPPSLEQLWWMAALAGGPRRPPLAVVVLSRVLDGPRRLRARWRAGRGADR